MIFDSLLLFWATLYTFIGINIWNGCREISFSGWYKNTCVNARIVAHI